VCGSARAASWVWESVFARCDWQIILPVLVAEVPVLFGFADFLVNPRRDRGGQLVTDRAAIMTQGLSLFRWLDGNADLCV